MYTYTGLDTFQKHIVEATTTEAGMKVSVLEVLFTDEDYQKLRKDLKETALLFVANPIDEYDGWHVYKIADITLKIKVDQDLPF